MSSNSSSPIQAMLTFAALLLIPTFAVFGVPRFVPMSNSNEVDFPSPSRASAIGKSDVYVEPAKFYPNDKQPLSRSNPSGSAVMPTLYDRFDSSHQPPSTTHHRSITTNNSIENWNDPFLDRTVQPALTTTNKPALQTAVTISNSSPILTWEKFDREIRLLGVSEYSLVSAAPGKFLLSCSVPSPNDKQLMRKFSIETTEPLVAANQLLADIQVWITQ